MRLTKAIPVLTAVAAVCSLVFAGPGAELAARDEPGPIGGALSPSEILPSSPDLVALGRTTYDQQCQACHGPEGDGEGEAAYLLYPRPRDLTSGEFRLVSTWDSVPTDQDLFGAISRGMPGSAMPSWSHLPEKTRWGLVHYVKTLSRRPLDAAPAQEPNASGDGGAGLLTVPPEPELTPEASARARYLF